MGDLADLVFDEGFDAGHAAGVDAGAAARVTPPPDGQAVIPHPPAGPADRTGAAWAKGWRQGYRAGYRAGRQGLASPKPEARRA